MCLPTKVLQFKYIFIDVLNNLLTDALVLCVYTNALMYQREFYVSYINSNINL